MQRLKATMGDVREGAKMAKAPHKEIPQLWSAAALDYIRLEVFNI